VIARALSQLPLQVLSVVGSSAICDNTPGLIGQQRRLCRVNPDVMLSVAYGAHLAVRECQKQFRNSRWNCSTLPRDSSVFGKATVQGLCEFREKFLIISYLRLGTSLCVSDLPDSSIPTQFKTDTVRTKPALSVAFGVYLMS
jgi:hypothetical protein